MPDTLYKSFNLLNILQKVRDFRYLVYKALKTSLSGWFSALCAQAGLPSLRYPLPKSLPSGEGLAAEAALRACRPCRFAPVCVFPLFCTREVFFGAPVCVSARFCTRENLDNCAQMYNFIPLNRNSMVLDIIKNVAVVGAGSFIGGAARYLVSLLMKGIGKGFPWATLSANLVGCFLIGFLWGLFSRTASEGSNWALFLTVGLCGGFTTFSTFSKEALMMLQSGNLWGFAGYIALSVIAGIALVAAGYYFFR